jgi:hypothetical protein
MSTLRRSVVKVGNNNMITWYQGRDQATMSTQRRMTFGEKVAVGPAS